MVHSILLCYVLQQCRIGFCKENVTNNIADSRRYTSISEDFQIAFQCFPIAAQWAQLLSFIMLPSLITTLPSSKDDFHLPFSLISSFITTLPSKFYLTMLMERTNVMLSYLCYLRLLQRCRWNIMPTKLVCNIAVPYPYNFSSMLPVRIEILV